MAIISITPMFGAGLVIHGRSTPVGSLTDGDTVYLNVDVTATSSAPLGTAYNMVRLCSDTTCWLDMASAAVATPSASGAMLPANATEYLMVRPNGRVISVVAK